jgi:hypothetical protein
LLSLFFLAVEYGLRDSTMKGGDLKKQEDRLIIIRIYEEEKYNWRKSEGLSTLYLALAQLLPKFDVGSTSVARTALRLSFYLGARPYITGIQLEADIYPNFQRLSKIIVVRE